MVVFFRKAPFFRILLMLVSGILFRLYIPVNYSLLHSLSITVILWFGLISLNKISKNIKYQWIFALSLYLLVFNLGFVVCHYRLNQITSQYLPIGDKVVMQCKLEDAPQEKKKTYKLSGLVEQYYRHDTLVYCKSKIIVYLAKSESARKLSPGDVILIKSIPDRIRSNTSGFNYAAYMFKQGVLFSAYVPANKWTKIDSSQLSYLERVGFSCKNYLLQLFKDAGLSGRDYAVATALTIGYKVELDAEIKQAYSSSGTMHILAVSGLHVGILYIVLNFILGFLDKFKIGKIFRISFIIGFIWFYSFLSGLSPSVLRSAVMISFICIGQVSSRQAFIHNSIAGSAVLLLLYDPLQISDVGFQLSYAAVIAIIIFYPPIYKWFKFRNTIIDQMWQLSAVSLAAQIGTLPMTIYYFNQFPSMFLVSNVLAIPISTFAMYVAFLLIPLSAFTFIFHFLGKILQMLVSSLNGTVLWIESLPYSHITGLKFNGLETCLWYCLIISLSVYFMQKRASFLLASLVIILCILWVNIINVFGF